MYDYDNHSQNSDGSASDSGVSTGSSSEYRYSGPFYQDNISSGSSSENREGSASFEGTDSSSGSSSGYHYSYSSGSYRNTGEVPPKKKNKKKMEGRLPKPSALRWSLVWSQGRRFRDELYRKAAVWR